MPNSPAIAAAVAPVVQSLEGGPPLVHTAECAAQHFAPWMIEERWFRAAVEAVKSGTLRPVACDDDEKDEEGRCPGYTVHNGTAIVTIAGAIMKKASKFGGTSSVATRQAIRKAVQDESVTSILLHIDSPGGTVAGTGDLAADVKAANVVKPVHAHIDDLGASAAYWVASQAERITANPTGEVGSIGTVLRLEDTSGMYTAQGIKVHVISTGKFKGAGFDGAPITDEHLAMFQQEVDDLNEHFLQGVAKGRKGKMSLAQVREAADGRVHIAAKAMAMGLIDDVASLESAFAFIQKNPRQKAAASPAPAPADFIQPIQSQAPEASPRGDAPSAVTQETPTMAEAITPSPAPVPAAPAAGNVPQGNPQPTEAEARRHEMVNLNQKACETLTEQGRLKGVADGRKLERERAEAIVAACPGKPEMALNAILSDQNPAAVQMTYKATVMAETKAKADLDAMQAENDRWRALALISSAGHPGVATAMGVTEDAQSAMDPKARAEWEWDNDPAARKTARSREIYVIARTAELDGTHHSVRPVGA